MSSRKLTIALAGNPNSGKTTIFNNITGARQRVGNWGGVTVEKKEGFCHYDGREITIVDLPGTYSLTPYSLEEIIARNYIVREKPDVVIDVVDASNLERNLYLVTQLIELGPRLVIALNMKDVADKRGIRIDIETLSTLLGVPIISTIGSSNIGTRELLEAAVRVAEGAEYGKRKILIPYGREIEEELEKIQKMIEEAVDGGDLYPPARWLAVKLLENDAEAEKLLVELAGDKANSILESAEKSRKHIKYIYGEEPEIVLTDQRYGFITGALRETVRMPPLDRKFLSDKIDTVLTNRLLGFPIFFFIIWLMFQLTFSVGAYPASWLDSAVSWLGRALTAVTPPGVLRDLLVEGVVAGVGGVLVFLPNIFILFFWISLLEDTGYMARAAFIMDKVMHTLGLHGKSFIPLIMGFGCNVPAIMATRILENRRDRLLTMLINPLISCSARLPVYTLIAGAFFMHKAGTVIFAIYILGIALAVLMGQLFSKTLFKGDAAPFVMELPPYRLPTLKSTIIHMWERGKVFIQKMGSVILIGSVLVWFLSSFPINSELEHKYDILEQRTAASYDNVLKSSPNMNESEKTAIIAREEAELEALETMRLAELSKNSYLGRIGHGLSIIFEPLGFDWRLSVALLTGFVAKEIVVSTLGVLYQIGPEADEKSESLREAIRKSGLTSATAFAFMAFVLIYTPCIATVAAIRRESGTWKWALFSIAYALTLAWLVSFTIVQIGRALGAD